MTKDEQLLVNRFCELANTTYNKNISQATDFLSLYEQDLFFKIKDKLPPVSIELCGGTSFAERKMVLFYPDEYSLSENSMIAVICIQPVNSKFSDELSHRDYLGALMNLGIERGLLGDIYIQDNKGYVFCKRHICDFIIQNLCMAKHTAVVCSQTDIQLIKLQPKMEEMKGSVASLRLDCILAFALKSSRSKLSVLIEQKKVFVNSRLMESNSYHIKEGDVISVRGYGKFLFQEVQNKTKKGREYIILQKYS